MVAPNRFKICVTRAREMPSPSDCGSRGDLAGLQLAQPFEGALQRMAPITRHTPNPWFSCRSEIHDDARRKVLT